jgi:hypothetical protein
MSTPPRSFNILAVNKDEVRKQSTLIEKIVDEFKHYYVMSKNHQKFLVRPHSLKVTEKFAEYAMKKESESDAGFLYANNMLNVKDFKKIIKAFDKFYSFSKTKSLDVESSYIFAKTMIIDKTKSRLADLDSMANKKFKSLSDNVFDRLMIAFESEIKDKAITIAESHGDLCLSNILICHDGRVRFIDPRGASSLWLDLNYDLAKLSQSVLGEYDFIVNQKNPGVETNLIKKEFRKFLSKNNINYKLLMIYQASLFLSMCPLHMEDENRINRFISAANKSLTEIGY